MFSGTRPVARAPSQPPGIAPAMPAARIDPVDSAFSRHASRSLRRRARSRRRGSCPPRGGCPCPTERTSAGMRSVPRMTPTAPPSTPIRSRERDSAPEPKPTLRPSRDRAERQVDPAPEENGGDQPVRGATRRRRLRGARRRRRRPTDGNAIQATTRQSTRPSRACRRPPAPAAAAEIAMFVPAARERAPGREHDERQPQRPEDEPEHRAEVAGDESGRER